MVTHDETNVLLEELDTRMDRLRASYEQYFTGIERTVPAVQHKDVERRLQTLRKLAMRNTGQKFRFQTLVQKYTTYLQYWQRITRQIEEGTFKRDVARATRYGRATPRPNATEDSDDNAYELDASALEDFDSSDLLDDEEQTNERPALVRPAVATAVATAAPTPATVTKSTRQIEELPLNVFETVREIPATAKPIAPSPQPATPAPAAATAAPAKRAGLSVFGVAQKTPATTSTAPAPKPAAPAPTPAPVAQPRPAAAVPAHAQAPAPAPARPAPAPAAPAGTARDASIENLYERYVDSRKRNGESSVEYQSLARQVNETLPKLREKYPGKHVELDVVIKDGKTVLRPVIRGTK
ncbi:MAG: MXAN_5187 C-terminal domain-containing protein [Deltaproteobacteria bacterium]|nr:MXAN_5187 C-terminal domain-containing protein [Deltaproteobacteria bacterium]